MSSLSNIFGVCIRRFHPKTTSAFRCFSVESKFAETSQNSSKTHFGFETVDENEKSEKGLFCAFVKIRIESRIVSFST